MDELIEVLNIGADLSNDGDAKLQIVERMDTAATELVAISERATDSSQGDAVAELGEAVSVLAASSEAALNGRHTSDPSSDAAQVELAIHDLEQICG